MNKNQDPSRKDIYSRITAQTVSSLNKGIKPCTQPWNAAHADGPVSEPLRFNGEAHTGINKLKIRVSSTEVC